MSGRRVRAAVKAAIDANTGDNSSTVVIAGLSNAYADYTTTYEEFQAQRYEGGSTIYGTRPIVNRVMQCYLSSIDRELPVPQAHIS